MQILVVGGSGFIGASLVRELCGKGHNVTVYHRGVHEPPLPASVRHIRSLLASNPVLEFPLELTGANFDVVIHMTLVGAADTDAFLDAFGPSRARVVVVSSMDVYARFGRLLGLEKGADASSEPLCEDSPLRTSRYPYGTTWQSSWAASAEYDKVIVEEVIASRMAGRATVLRLPVVYGPGDLHRRFALWLRRMNDGRSALVVGRSQASSRFTYGYVDDVAHAIAIASISSKAEGQIYNVGESTPLTLVELLTLVGDIVRWKGVIVQVEETRLPDHLKDPYNCIANIVLDTSLVREHLGYAEGIARNEGFRRAIEWENSVGTPFLCLTRQYEMEDALLRSSPTAYPTGSPR